MMVHLQKLQDIANANHGTRAVGTPGYEATVVNGQVFMENGEHTGALAGVTLRS